MTDDHTGHDVPGTKRSRHRRVWMIGGLVVVAGLLAAAAINRGDDAEPELVLPPGAVPIDVWAPYWTYDDIVPEIDDRFPDIRELSPFMYGAHGVSRITLDAQVPADLTDEFMEAARDSSVRIVPSIRDELPAGAMAAILANPTNRTRHIDAIMELADELDADGIDLDYEKFAFSDGRDTWAETQPNWVAFVAELAERLHADDLTLTISIPPVYDEAATGGDRGFWVYDHGAIAEHADAIRIMAYDYSVPDPGPIAPLAWVQQAVDGTSLAVAPEYHDKLVLGVPAYGTNWVVSTTGDCPATAEGRTNVTSRSVGELIVRREGVPQYDDTTGEWYFTYDLDVDDGVTSCVQSRKVHWVDSEGAASRVEIARRAGWGGVALWALGYEDQAVWDAIVTASREPLPAELA